MFESYGWVELHRRLYGGAVLVILVSSPVQSFEIWSSTGLSLDNKTFLSLIRGEADSERNDVGIIEKGQHQNKIPVGHGSRLGMNGIKDYLPLELLRQRQTNVRINGRKIILDQDFCLQILLHLLVELI